MVAIAHAGCERFVVGIFLHAAMIRYFAIPAGTWSRRPGRCSGASRQGAGCVASPPASRSTFDNYISQRYFQPFKTACTGVCAGAAEGPRVRRRAREGVRPNNSCYQKEKDVFFYDHLTCIAMRIFFLFGAGCHHHSFYYVDPHRPLTEYKKRHNEN